MRKKSLWIVVVSGIVITGVIVLLWIWSARWMSAPPEPFGMVPQDAEMIMDINDLPAFIEQITTENQLWQDMLKIPGLSDVDSMLRRSDTLMNSIQVFRQLFRRNPVLVSIHPIGKNKLTMLGIVHIPGYVKATAIRKAFSDLGLPGEGITVKNYNGHKIYVLASGDQRKTLYFSIVQGLLLISPSQIILESSLRQQSVSTSLANQQMFVKIRNTAGENSWANLYFQPGKIPDWLGSWLNGTTRQSMGNTFPLSGWSEMDINLQRESVLLNGFSALDNSDNQMLGIFRDADPGLTDLFKVFPSTSFAGAIISSGDWSLYHKQLSSLRKKKGNDPFDTVLDTYNEQCGCDWIDTFTKIMGSQAGIAFLNISNQSAEKNRIAVFQLKSQSLARNELEKIIKNYAARKGSSFSSFTRKISIDPETIYTLYTFPFQELPEAIFGNVFGKGPYPRFTFYENYLVIGGSDAVLTRFLRDNILRHTLGNDADFKSFTEGLSSRANFFLYVRLPVAAKLMEHYFNVPFMKSYHAYVDKQMKINFIGYQAIAQNHMIYNNLYLRYGDEIKKYASTVWESLLDTTTHYKPQLFTNHYTGAKEIFIQDLTNQLYLINKAGRILWKVKIPEKIEGQAYQIDFYRNGKLQILFNTRHYLYLIDRNGNNVEHFPVALRSPASNGIAIFDYEKNKNYRIFVGGDDKRVYLYNKEGNLVQGWKMNKYESSVTTPIQHFSIKGKDYIVFSDTMNIYVLDRRGNRRFSNQVHIPRVIHQQVVLDDFSEHAPSLLVNGMDGEVYRIGLNGKVISSHVEDVPDDSYFDYADLDGDRKGEYIFLAANNLTVYHSTGKKKFVYTLPDRITDPPILFTFSAADKKIGVMDATNRMIYLVNKNGTLYNGFPLKGCSLFTIGKFESAGTRFNLIVGGEDNFLYNYIVK